MYRFFISIMFLFLLDTYLRVELLNLIVTLMFNHLRNYQIVFQSVCTVLQFYQHCIRTSISISLHPHQLLLSVVCYPMEFRRSILLYFHCRLKNLNMSKNWKISKNMSWFYFFFLLLGKKIGKS